MTAKAETSIRLLVTLIQFILDRRLMSGLSDLPNLPVPISKL